MAKASLWQRIKGWFSGNKSAKSSGSSGSVGSAEPLGSVGLVGSAGLDGSVVLFGLFGLFGTDMTVIGTEQNTVSGTDTGGVFHMDCGGIPMTMRYSFEQDGDCDLRIHGSQGALICRSFWKSDRYRIQSGDEEREYQFPFRSEFTFEAQQLSS